MAASLEETLGQALADLENMMDTGGGGGGASYDTPDDLEPPDEGGEGGAPPLEPADVPPPPPSSSSAPITGSDGGEYQPLPYYSSEGPPMMTPSGASLGGGGGSAVPPPQDNASPFLFGVGPRPEQGAFGSGLDENQRFGDIARGGAVGRDLSPYLALMYPGLYDDATTKWGVDPKTIEDIANNRLGSNMNMRGLLSGLGGAVRVGLQDDRLAASLPDRLVDENAPKNRRLNEEALAEDWRSNNLRRVTPEVGSGYLERVYGYESGRTDAERPQSGGALGYKPAVSKSGQEYFIDTGQRGEPRYFERRGDELGNVRTASYLNQPIPPPAPPPSRTQPYGAARAPITVDDAGLPNPNNRTDRTTGNTVIVSENRDRYAWAPAGSTVERTGPPGGEVIIVRTPDGQVWRYDASTGLPLGPSTPNPRAAPARR